MRRCPVELVLLTALALPRPAAAAWDPETGTITNERWESGLPLGGLGCGQVALLTDGSLADFTGQHNWDRPTGRLRGAFFAVAAGGQGRLLRRPSEDEYANVTDIATVETTIQFPRGTWRFSDEGLPVRVELRAFSPWVPGNVADSSLPAAAFEFRVTNLTAAPQPVAVALAWPNLVGFGGRRRMATAPAAERGVEPFEQAGLAGLRYSAPAPARGDDPAGNAIGETCLGVVGDQVQPFTVTGWDAGAVALGWWDAFVAGEGAAGEGGYDGLVGGRLTLAPAATRTVRFVLSWYLPHHVTVGRVAVLAERSEEVHQGTTDAFDDRPDTRWTTNRPMLPGDAFEVDLAQRALVDRVVLDLAGSPRDYPRGLEVEAGGRGRNWRHVLTLSRTQVEALLRLGVLAIDLPPTEAERLRLVQTGDPSWWWWSIHELAVYDSSGERVTLADARAQLRSQETRELVEDVGDAYSARYASAAEVAADVAARWDALATDSARWQGLITGGSLPSWLKRKLLNDLAVLAGNSVLTRDGRFALLESPVDGGGALGAVDQRLTAQGALLAFYPALDAQELKLFAACQGVDGRVPRTCGNVHQAVGDARVAGEAGGADTTASWVVQVARHWLATGDEAFRSTTWPHVLQAMDWLASADADLNGDGLPDAFSGSNEKGPVGDTSTATAGLVVAAWRAALALARAAGDEASTERFGAELEAARDVVVQRLWNGQYLDAGLTDEGQRLTNCLATQLSGDWASRAAGLGPILGDEVLRPALKHLLARNQRPFWPVLPLQVTPDGQISGSETPLLPLQAEVGAEAIAQGFVDDGLATLRRVYETVWYVQRSPWSQTLISRVPGGAPVGMRSHLSALSSWEVLGALTGAAVDLPHHTLHLAPVLPAGVRRLHLPLLCPTFTAWLDYAPDQDLLRLEVVAAGSETSFELIVGAPGTAPVRLPKPFVAAAGAVLELGNWHRQLQPDPESKDVGFTVWPASRGDDERRGWRARAEGDELPLAARTEVALAFDGDAATRWTTHRDMQDGDSFTVDFAAERRIARLDVVAGTSRRDFPKGLELDISPDGSHWTALRGVAILTGDDGSVRALFDPVTTRWLRLVNHGTAKGLWWSIHELRVAAE